ncbi:O-antigen ligase family protein [Thermoanaerobacter mathranii]|uniref:O-antigen ligase family protein n=1 Tax=Thermoanaerobacter mathranii TaxID=583357 RepID=UPI003D6C184F
MRSGSGNGLLTNFIIFWLFFYVLFAERFVLKIETGGKGIVSIPVLISFLLVFYVILKSKGKALEVFKSKFFMYWWPFVILTVLFPILGVLLTGYPLRTILNLNVLSEISFIVTGYWVSKRMDFWEFTLSKYLVLAIIIEFLYSFLQSLYRIGYFHGYLWEVFASWDLISQQLYASPIFGRSIGTFVNPNTLGFWAITVFGFSLYLTKGWIRYLSLIFSFLTLILSQSRGCLFALIFAIGVILISNLLTLKKINFTQFLKGYIFFMVVAFIMIFIVKLGLVNNVTFERFRSGIEVFLYGVSADQNFLTRVEVWKQSLGLFRKYPLGTFGPPELILGTAVDSDWVRLLLQGGIIYVVSFLIAIFAGILIPKSTGSKIGKFLLYMSLTLPVVAVSETPTIYIPMAIYWFALGVFLQEE